MGVGDVPHDPLDTALVRRRRPLGWILHLRGWLRSSLAVVGAPLAAAAALVGLAQFLD